MVKKTLCPGSVRFAIWISVAFSMAVPASAKTIMWLGNFFQQGAFQNGDIGGVDSIWVRHSDTSTNNGNGYYLGAGNLKLTKAATAYVDTARTRSAMINWWSIPNWNGNLYRENRFRMNLSYKKFNGPTATPRYQNENSETQEMNGRYTSHPGVIDSCLDMVPGDTVWMYWGLGQTASAQTKPICSDHNPYLKTIGTIHLLNPWPGRTAYVLFNNKWLPLYGEPGRPGWVTTTFHALPGAVLDQKLVFASANPASGADIQYMDMTGIGIASRTVPFDMSALATPWERWIAPAVDGTNAPKVLTTAPKLSTTLMVQKPTWGASAIRVTWQGVPGLFIAQSTAYCDWFAISFYEGLVPKSIVLNHPFQDTIVGSKGIQKHPGDLAGFADWISIPSSAGTDTIWLGTTGAPAASPVKPTGTSVKICNEKILAFKVYDYLIKGPYFPFSEKTNSDHIKGIVGAKLGADGLPTYTGKSMCGTGDPRSVECTNPANGPNNWFKARPDNTTGCLQQPLKLNPATGQYEYSSDAYFPLDTLIKVAPFNETLAPSQTQSQDFGFCMHAKSTFEYVRGLTFSFRGDDDVWVFIDKTLALDLGGQHGPISGNIDLDKLNLLEGRAYQFDMFYCERHTPGSNIKIQTTMNLVPSYDFRFDSTSVGANGIKIDLSYIKTEIDGSKCQDAAAQTPVPGKGYFFVQYPDGRTEAIAPPPGVSQFSGIAIAPDLTSVQVDLEAVKKNPQFKQRGTYKIVVRFQNDPSQANVKEIPFEISSGPVNLVADLYDLDGDGKADSLTLHSPEEGTFQGTDLKRTGIVWSTSIGSRDSVVVATRPTSVGAGDSVAGFAWNAATTPFQRSSSCPTGGCVRSGTVVTVAASTSDSNFNPIAVLREHIAPFADSARLSFGTGAVPDTLRIWIGEGAVRNPAATALDVWAKVGQPSAPRDVAVLEFAILSNGRELRFVLPPGHGIGPADQVRVAGLVSDSLLNAATKSSVWVPIRSNPAGTAALYDADGDGMADSLHVLVRGSLAGAAAVKIDWIDSSGAPVSRIWPVAGPVSGSFPVLGGSQPFPKGATSCPGGACFATFFDALGAPMGVAPVMDGVAPMAVRGHCSFGEAFDTLGVRFSEPVVAVSDLPVWVEWGITGVLAGQLAHKSMQLVSPDSGYFVLDTLDGIRSAVYDSIRLASGAHSGKLTDLGGTRVGRSSPWAPLSIGLRPFTLRIQTYPPEGVLSNSSRNPSIPVWLAPPATIPAVEVFFADAPMGTFRANPDFKDFRTLDGALPQNTIDKVLAVRILLNRPLDGRLFVYDNMGTHVASVDLSRMREVWTADSDDDAMREVWLAWNGTDGSGKFAASGVYLFRAFVKVDVGDGTSNVQNLVWKLGWHRDTK